MAHEVRIVEVQELNNEQVAYRAVCCGLQCSLKGGDPALGCTPDSHKCHDHWCTTTTGAPDHDAMLQDFMRAVADKHETKLKWKADKAQNVKNSVLAVNDTGDVVFTVGTDADTL